MAGVTYPIAAPALRAPVFLGEGLGLPRPHAPSVVRRDRPAVRTDLAHDAFVVTRPALGPVLLAHIAPAVGLGALGLEVGRRVQKAT